MKPILAQARKNFSANREDTDIDAIAHLPPKLVDEDHASQNIGRRIIVILLGAPGSGKGTQSKSLSNALAIPTISSGDILRANIRAETDLGISAKEAIDHGVLVSDHIILKMLASRLSLGDCRNGFLLDGIPRTVNQAEFLDAHFSESAYIGFDRPRVVSLEVGEDTLIKRVAGRRICPHCGAIYNIETSPPRIANFCNNDGSILETRNDDRVDVCRSRLRDYRRDSVLIKSYYSSKGRDVIEIDGGRDADIVCAELLDVFSTVK